MTYSVGGTIQAADYNGFVGTTAVNSPYASSIAATNKLAALIGVGYGNRGYGQTSTTLADVAAGNTVTAVQWNNLLNAMSTMNTHQGSGLTLQPTVAAGGTILYQPNIPTNIAALDTNRLNANVINMSLSSVLTSSSAAWSGSVQHVFTVTFADSDAARYFFNSGGQVRFSGLNNGTTSVALNFQSLFTAMGTIKFGANATTYTGAGGTVAAIGYYGLTTSNQQTFIHYGTGVYYSGIYYSIQAKTNAVGTANGGNGNILTFTVTMSDASVPYAYGNVDGTTTSYIESYRAIAPLTIASPSYSTTTPL
jgi:hypothetical protein